LLDLEPHHFLDGRSDAAPRREARRRGIAAVEEGAAVGAERPEQPARDPQSVREAHADEVAAVERHRQESALRFGGLDREPHEQQRQARVRAGER
jgi:hypothetical protein